jgi:hypothetical protein
MDVCGWIIDCRMIKMQGLPLSILSDIVIVAFSTRILRGLSAEYSMRYASGTISTKVLRVIIDFS